MAMEAQSQLNKAQVEALENFSFIPEVEVTFIEQPTNADKIAFWTLQGLDVYTTYRGVKYDCIKEGNPLLDDTPSIADMVLLKYFTVGQYPPKTLEQYRLHNSFGSIVVYNNYSLWEQAHKKCRRR
jgi:hypothetical protein